jgi:TM2 domain-containing membrane protein YozV
MIVKNTSLADRQRQFMHQNSTPPRTKNRALVICAALLAGIFGTHKFLLGARREGYLYLFFCWTAIPLLAGLADFIDLMRQPALGQGFLKRRLLKRHVDDADVIERATWLQLGRACLLFMLFAASSVWITHRINQGHDRVSTLCKQTLPGTPAEDVTRFAAANGLRAGAIRNGDQALIDTASMGRHSCYVRIEGGKVTLSEHHFND